MTTDTPTTIRGEGRVPTNRQTVPRADREAEILEAAIDEFTAHGFDATTVAAVAARAGMTAANVHYYFGGKDDLFAATVVAFYDRLRQDLDRRPDPRDRLRRYVLLHREHHPLRAAVQSVAARNEHLAAGLAERDGWLRATAAELAASELDRDVLVAVVIGLVEDTTPHPDPVAVLDTALSRQEA